jgi:1-pyrroline-5-carboxylate dehydrogenase
VTCRPTLQDLTHVFKDIWAKIGTHHPLQNIPKNCRGKDFIIAHSSANPKQVDWNVVLLNFKVKKKSAASRAYVPKNKLSLM